jgi:hypothetical protein
LNKNKITLLTIIKRIEKNKNIFLIAKFVVKVI